MKNFQQRVHETKNKKKQAEITDREFKVLEYLVKCRAIGAASIEMVSDYLCPNEEKTVYLESKRTKCFKKEKGYYACSPTAKRVIKSLCKKKFAVTKMFLLSPTALGKAMVPNDDF